MFTFHTATPDDAEQIAEIIAVTSDGVVDHLFGDLVNGLSSRHILSAAFMKGEGPYHTDNVIRSLDGEKIVSLLFSYPSAEHQVPPLMESLLPAKRLNAVRPLLERSVEDSLYINSFWVQEGLRGTGHADALMLEAVSRCGALGFGRISLFCWNDNERAMHFYARHGFTLFELLPPDALAVRGHQSGGSILCLSLPGA